MTDKLVNRVHEARRIARALCDLLHEDSLHRMQLYVKYARDPADNRWTPDLYRRCQLAEALCEKLETLVAEGVETGASPATLSAGGLVN